MLGRVLRPLLFALPFLAIVPPVSVQAADCQFVQGFSQAHAAMPDRVGDCLENETHNEYGDGQQRTTTGLLVWRKADNWTAFNDGQQIIVYAPPPPPPSSVADIVAQEAAKDGISPATALCVAKKETGLTPTSRGYYVGLFQLGPGELANFYAHGFSDWSDPRQQTAFFALRLRQGAGTGTWPTLRGC